MRIDKFSTSGEREPEKVNANGYFKAKYDGVCKSCGFSIDKGEECHYIGNQIAHGTCHSFSGNNSLANEVGEHEEREPSYVVRGRRKPPLCKDCFEEHNGECP